MGLVCGCCLAFGVNRVQPCTGASHEPLYLGTGLHVGAMGARLLLGQARSLGLRSQSGTGVRLEPRFMGTSLIPRWPETGSSGATI